MLYSGSRTKRCHLADDISWCKFVRALALDIRILLRRQIRHNVEFFERGSEEERRLVLVARAFDVNFTRTQELDQLQVSNPSSDRQRCHLAARSIPLYNTDRAPVLNRLFSFVTITCLAFVRYPQI